MNHPISDLTYKVIAYTEMPKYNTDEFVDWAYDMIALGFETENLLILAGLTKPTNYFEAIRCFNATIKELGINQKIGEEGIISYSSYYVRLIAQSIDVKVNLLKVYEYFISIGHHNSLYDFYLLNWAWSDIDYGNEIQEYWPEATSSNIKQIVVDYSSSWLVKNKKQYSIE